MRARLLRLVAAAGVALASLGAMTGVATAQIAPPPLPPIPPLPTQLTPVLLVISPIAAPNCGTAGSLAIAATGLVPVAAATPLIGYAFGPVFIACGNVPVPASSSELVCAQDDQVLAALSTVTLVVIGSGPPVSTRLVGPIVESATVLEAMTPAQVQSLGAAGLLSDALACRVSHPVAAPAKPSAPEVANAPESDDDVALPDLALSDEVFGFADVPGATDEVFGEEVQPVIRPAGAVAAARPFDYPMVFVLPLVLLAVGGYLARSLTEDVRLPS